MKKNIWIEKRNANREREKCIEIKKTNRERDRKCMEIKKYERIILRKRKRTDIKC